MPDKTSGMNCHLLKYGAVALVGVTLIWGTGCGKKAAPAPVAAVTQGIPGAAEVMEALAKKDYEAALAALTKAKQEANEEQQPQVMQLFLTVKDKLNDLAPTDPKAAEALSALRMSSIGR